MRILIIRHGDPDYTIDSLTEKGWREAEMLSLRLEHENITSVYLSPLGRAQATAQPTLRKTGLTGVTLDWLREFPVRAKVDYEEGRVCPWNLPPSYWTKFPGVDGLETWRKCGLYDDSGIPEKYDEICAEFDALIEKHGYRRKGRYFEILDGHEEDTQTIALFCHLGLGNVLLSHIAGVALPVWWHQVFLPTSSVTVAFMERHRPEEHNAILRLAGIGDTSHLFACGEPVSDSGLFNHLA